ncbi:MAG: PilT/PilU family type 4a pilus ATPase [Acidobacteria bacterium]|nr:PilT/PilU family type 4a pilus ATPase [Acidobacteriota bacterium]NIM63971.1 PilT/PilU family type 4a pilus ATPase [Acidobacteriota bacterium]NIO59376.1 PilT/PilU family type 4a pilus ATPase [Acidobacteriota bacterium]NIQ30412.1 PilT/PilU family type 4a pilus ATPase [Acidobacteriota bacterium]NIQ85338.1 PilT/PilU family type 4a pilus ATPase [Acidobacteriota bacterium]
MSKTMDLEKLSIDNLLRFMVEQQASDLHIKPMRPPLMRLKGKLLPLKCDPISPEAVQSMLQGILNDRLREILDRDMAVDFGYSVPGVSRFRASVFLQRGTCSAAFRRVPFNFPSLQDWGLPPVLADFAKLPQGLVLITGPTGSGKSSTLAALMRLIADTRLVHIVTVEDPIEFLFNDNLAAVTQREIGTDTPSFQMALPNALRQDPDVIMVGEMRDVETMQTVLTAAETGHLVFSTLHTNSAAQTIDRIIDSFPEGNHRQIRQQLAAVLQAVVSMKLVERKDGSGLTSAVEILTRTPRVTKLIHQGNLEALDEEIESSVAYHKMQSMNQSLAALVVNNQVEMETALGASANPGDLDLILRKFLYAASAGQSTEGDEMAEPLSDFSKILELQEVKKHYDDLQERHQSELTERDNEIAELHARLAEYERNQTAGGSEAEKYTRETERLNKQIAVLRQEYEAKIERLSSRIRELSGGTERQPVAAEASEKKGFFRR